MADIHLPDSAGAERAAAEVRHQMHVQLKTAEARTPGDWIDIFQEIVEFTVRTTMEEHGEGSQVLEKLEPTRSAIKQVRARLMEHGLPLLENIDIDGPDIRPDAMGCLTNVSWHRGQWVKLCWPHHKDVLEFRGQQALVALSFVMWWSNFHQTAKQWDTQLQGGQAAVAGARRMIEPGSPEWVRYFTAKQADQGGSIPR